MIQFKQTGVTKIRELLRICRYCFSLCWFLTFHRSQHAEEVIKYTHLNTMSGVDKIYSWIQKHVKTDLSTVCCFNCLTATM